MNIETWKDYAFEDIVFRVSPVCIMVCIPIKEQGMEYTCAFTVEKCTDGSSRVFHENAGTVIEGYSGLTLGQTKFLIELWKEWEE